MKIDVDRMIKTLAVLGFKTQENYVKLCEIHIKEHLLKLNELFKDPAMMYLILDESIDAFTSLKNNIKEELIKSLEEFQGNEKGDLN